MKAKTITMCTVVQRCTTQENGGPFATTGGAPMMPGQFAHKWGLLVPIILAVTQMGVVPEESG